jgi:hypothetical protein
MGDVSPAFARLYRQSERALLTAEAALLASLRGKVNAATADVVAELLGLKGSPRAVRAKALAFVVARADQLSSELAEAMTAARDTTSRVALATLRAQLGLVLRLATESGATGQLGPLAGAPAALASATEDRALSRASAHLSARSLATAWAGSVSASMVRPSKAEAAPVDLAREVRSAVKRHDARIGTTATTDTVAAFNGARESALLTLKGVRFGNSRFLPFLGKHWNATLDKRTCPVCSSHSGDTVAYHKAFAGGFTPGFHPNCRCILELIFMPLPTQLGAAA